MYIDCYSFLFRWLKHTCNALNHEFSVDEIHSTTMAESCKQSRAVAKRFFTRAESALRLTLTPEALEDTIRRRFEELCKRWEQVQDSHDAYICSLGEVDDGTVASEDEWLDELSARFHELEVKVDCEIHSRESSLEDRIQKVKDEYESKAATHTTPTDPVHHKSSSVQLERMRFSSFDGDIRKYPKFKEEFQTHIRPLCNSSQLPFVLKSYLVNEVKDEVDNVADNYEALWERLDEKYGDKGHLIDAIMSDIKSLKLCNAENGQNTLQMIKTVEKAYRDLARLGESDQMDNATIISLIEQKLPERILDEWVKEVSSHSITHKNRFSCLMKLLEEWRKRIKYKISAIRSRDIDMKGKINHNTTDFKGFDKSKQSDTSNRPKCWIHSENGEHPVWKCRVFQNKSSEERLILAKQHKACLLCLVSGHDADSCSITFRCSVPGCQGKHNRLLHDAIVAGSVNHSSGDQLPDQSSTILQAQDI